MAISLSEQDKQIRLRKILLLLAQGKTYREAGQELFIAETTVKLMMKKFLEEHGLKNTVAAVAYALRNKIIE